MICGTTFCIANVEEVWPRIAWRALRSLTDPAKISDVRSRCRDGGDALCLEGPDGVVIMAIEPSEAGPSTLMVLLAVSTALHGAFDRQESAMLAIARNLGASELAFRTDRRGWRRLVGPQWRLLPEQQGDRFTRTV